MKLGCLEYLECNACNGPLQLRQVSKEKDSEVLRGTIACRQCGVEFPVVRGVPRFCTPPSALQRVANSFGFEWTQHALGAFERETLFGRNKSQELQWFLDGLFAKPADIEKSVVLDAGCGRGRLTAAVGRLRPKAAFGIDISEAVMPAFAEARGADNVNIVQANMFALPFKPATFDYICSSGVLHHTGDARKAFSALARLLRPGGKMFVWVYPNRLNPFRLAKDLCDVIGLSRISHRRLLDLCRFLSALSTVGLKAYQLLRAIPLSAANLLGQKLAAQSLIRGVCSDLVRRALAGVRFKAHGGRDCWLVCGKWV